MLPNLRAGIWKAAVLEHTVPIPSSFFHSGTDESAYLAFFPATLSEIFFFLHR